MKLPAEQIADKIKSYVEGLLLSNETFTGKLEMNFKDGQLKDINETKRTKDKEIVVKTRPLHLISKKLYEAIKCESDPRILLGVTDTLVKYYEKHNDIKV